MIERPAKRLSQLGEGLELVAQYLTGIAGSLDDESVLRGQASQDWAIQPSALRPNAYGIRNHDHLARWKAMAGRFERVNSDLEWLSLAQHYGVATTLLDWTSNPLVALFFAAQSATRLVNQNADGVIYMTKSSGFQRIPAKDFDLFGEWADGPFFLLVEGTNRRAVTQSSVMTLHSVKAPQLPEYKPEIVFRLPGWAKFGVVAALAKMGVSAESMYADINSAASEFSRQLRFEGGS
jgi:hypothetical protein